MGIDEGPGGVNPRNPGTETQLGACGSCNKRGGSEEVV